MEFRTHISFGVFFALLGYLILGPNEHVEAFDLALLTCFFSLLPNIDWYIFKMKRTWATHSLFFPAAIFLLMSLPTFIYGESTGYLHVIMGYHGATFAALGVLSHIFADSFTTTGVPLLYPIIGRRHVLFPYLGPRLRFPDDYKGNYVQISSIVALIVLLVLDYLLKQ